MTSQPSPHFSALYQWSILILLGAIYFLATATTFTSLGVVLPGMIDELKWSWTEAGFGFTLLGLTCGLSSFLPYFYSQYRCASDFIVWHIGLYWRIL